MLILPDRHIPRAKLLLPLHEREWRQPSQRKTLGGIENQTWFSMSAFTSDGVRYWRGWFEDRADADAFVWHLARWKLCGEPMPLDTQRLPQKPRGWHTPFYSHWYPAIHEGEWRPEFIDLPLVYEQIFSTTFLTSPTGSNQTYTSPSDWNNASNTIETLGSGAGGAVSTTAQHSTGGGGGAYNFITNFSFATPGTTTATYQIGAGAAAKTTAGTGNNGNDSWFNNTTLAGSSVGSKGGSGGLQGAGSRNGGPGGASASGVGSGFDGGRGGNMTGASGNGTSGGGAAAGPNGVGGNGVDTTSTGSNVTTAGGRGDNSLGGTGGVAGAVGGAGDGNAGAEWQDAVHGSGGGGGSDAGSGTLTAGGGGLYGGGSGAVSANTPTSRAAAQGMVAVTYAVTVAGGFFLFFN